MFPSDRVHHVSTFCTVFLMIFLQNKEGKEEKERNDFLKQHIFSTVFHIFSCGLSMFSLRLICNNFVFTPGAPEGIKIIVQFGIMGRLTFKLHIS